MPHKPPAKESNGVVKAAIIGAIATIVAALITAKIIFPPQPDLYYFFTVEAKETGQLVPNASVTLDVPGHPLCIQ